MKHLILVLIIALLPHVTITAQNKPDVEILKFGWKKLPKRISPSGKKLQEMRNAPIDTRINEEYQKDRPNYALIDQLRNQKRNQVTPLDVPISTDKDYAYKFRFRNIGSKQIINLRWVYIFKDAATGQELLRRRFESNVLIESNKEKEVVAYTDSNPPLVVKGRLKEKPREECKEEVIIEKVEYSDGSRWEWQ